MGMFDNVRCHYPLPVPGANAREYQTKDTPLQWLAEYEITAEGILRHRDWDAEDGELGPWRYDDNFTGEIRFYDGDSKEWLEFSSYFIDGKLQSVTCVKNSGVRT